MLLNVIHILNIIPTEIRIFSKEAEQYKNWFLMGPARWC